jgi:hypothetical protein
LQYLHALLCELNYGMLLYGPHQGRKSNLLK